MFKVLQVSLGAQVGDSNYKFQKAFGLCWQLCVDSYALSYIQIQPAILSILIVLMGMYQILWKQKSG